MFLGHGGGNGETQAKAGFLSPGVIGPVKALKQMGQLILGNGLAGIGDHQLGMTVGFCNFRRMVPPSAPYLMALSSKMEIRRRSLSRSPVTVRSGAISYSRGFPASKATGSKARRSPWPDPTERPPPWRKQTAWDCCPPGPE